MLRGLYSSFAGMRAWLFRQDVVASNLANVSSHGYKQDLAVFRSFPSRSMVALEGEEGSVGSRAQPLGAYTGGVLLGEVRTDFSQGALEETGVPTDLALDGEGFFAVRRGGEILYTRNGSFHLDARRILVTSDSAEVLDEEGRPILVDGELVVEEDGTVNVNGAARTRLGLYAFDDLGSLRKVGGGYFSSTQAPRRAGVRVAQGYLEASNVNAVDQMVKMIEGLRAYESNQRLILAQDRTLEKLVNQTGKV
ncbi:MAG: flagellar hook-basal body protein [Actinomycetota bacterium]|nr:flagellar hook-basal body protein [Actinomycetota bacterium]MDI7251968.1 flagellar hook-basal body protein [Actinomycetota bacterium]